MCGGGQDSCGHLLIAGVTYGWFWSHGGWISALSTPTPFRYIVSFYIFIFRVVKGEETDWWNTRAGYSQSIHSLRSKEERAKEWMDGWRWKECVCVCVSVHAGVQHSKQFPVPFRNGSHAL